MTKDKGTNDNFNHWQEQQQSWVVSELIPVSSSPSYLFDFGTQGRYGHFNWPNETSVRIFQAGGAVEKGRLQQIKFLLHGFESQNKSPCCWLQLRECHSLWGQWPCCESTVCMEGYDIWGTRLSLGSGIRGSRIITHPFPLGLGLIHLQGSIQIWNWNHLFWLY